MIKAGNRANLEAELRLAGVQLNDGARELLADKVFDSYPASAASMVQQVGVAELGLPEGGTTEQLYRAARLLGFGQCPLLLGPYFRLHYRDQPEGAAGFPSTTGLAPPGSLTVACSLENVGFYLRKMEGILWLRGFRCDAEHRWSPEDQFVFCRGDKRDS